MTVKEIKVELEKLEKYLEELENIAMNIELSINESMELEKEIDMIYDTIESYESDLYNKENLIEYEIMNW